MKQSDIFRENAENCAQLAESATNEPLHLRYRRMEAAWWALADEQDWLDGEVCEGPNGKDVARVPRRVTKANVPGTTNVSSSIGGWWH